MKKILIVDDSETIRDQLKNIFNNRPDLQVVEAENGSAGLAKLEANPDVKLIISDVNMPEMDGITMVKRINSLNSYKSVPIVMLTTEVSKEWKDEAKANGVKAWIIKPFTPEKLLMAVDQLLKIS